MSRLFKAVAIGILLGLIGCMINVPEEVRRLEENIGLGLLFKLRGALKAPADAVVIAIDRQSAAQLNVSYNPERWPRTLHAKLINALHQAGVRVIVFDLYFLEQRSPEEDAALAAAVRSAGNVILAERLQIVHEGDAADELGSFSVKSEKPIDSLRITAFGTAPFVLPRMPVRVSQYWTFQNYAGDPPTFPVLALQLYALDIYRVLRASVARNEPESANRLPENFAPGSETSRAMRTIRQSVLADMALLGALQRAASAQKESNRTARSLVNLYSGSNRRYLNFYGPPRTVTTLSYHEALELKNVTKPNPINLRGKAVFVGLSENRLAETHDSFHTPFSRSDGVFISGVEIAATAFLNLLTDTSIRPAAPGAQALILLLWGILVVGAGRMMAPMRASFVIIGGSVCYLIAAAYEFRANTTWYPIFIPLFLQAPLGYVGTLLWDYREVNKERHKVREALGYYVPEEVVDRLARDRVDIRREGQTIYGACLFSDVAGYTTVTEKMSPRDVSAYMHQYLEATFEPIHKHGGLVIDLKGDSILAVWKGTENDLTVRAKACEAALGVADAVREFNQAADSVIKLPTRISVHAGPIYLGNIGAGAHYEYGVAGDTVTTASRLDGLNKYLGTRILISEEVVRDLKGYLTRAVGTFLMKGKSNPVVAHELIGRAAEENRQQHDVYALFSEARQAFQKQVWDVAKAQFLEVSDKMPEDRVAQFYLKLCEQYRAAPPPDPWNGTIAMDEK